MTGSKLANFCFIKDEEEYHDYYGIIFEGKPKPPFSEQAQEYMAYGRKHEDVAVCCFLDDAPARVGDIYLAESPFYKHAPILPWVRLLTVHMPSTKMGRSQKRE